MLLLPPRCSIVVVASGGVGRRRAASGGVGRAVSSGSNLSSRQAVVPAAVSVTLTIMPLSRTPPVRSAA